MPESSSRPTSWIAYDPRVYLGLLCAIAAIRLAQTPSVLTVPPLFSEDGGLFFEHFYNRRSSDPWLIYYQGYVSLGPNLLAWLISHVPTLQVPRAYWLVGQAVSTWALSIFCLPRFRTVVPSDGLRLIACAALAALPLGNGFLFTTVAWCFWPMLMASVLLCLVPPVRQRAPARLAEFVFLVVNACSSPASALLVPIYGWRVWRAVDVGERIRFTTLAVVTIAYVIVMRLELVSADWVVNADVADQLLRGDYTVVEAMMLTVPVIADRVVFEGLFTNRVRIALIYRGLHVVVFSIGLLVIGAAAWFARADHRVRAQVSRIRPFLLGVSYIGLTLTFIALWARFGRNSGLDYTSWAHGRYFWVQQYLLGVAAVSLFSPRLEALRTPVRRALSALLVVGIVASNLLDASDFSLGSAHPARLHTFLEELAYCEFHDTPEAGRCSLPMVFEQEMSWIDAHTITIRRFR